MSDTPRTDEVMADNEGRVPAWFARQLERELNDAIWWRNDAWRQLNDTPSTNRPDASRSE